MVFSAHRVLLASHSEKLKKVLTKVESSSSSSSTFCVYLTGVPGHQLGLVLQFLYCGEVRVKQISLLQNSRLLKNLEVDGIVEEAEDESKEGPG